jgi:tRNA1(Val) A37 N6-methylase TrmN6
LVGALRSTAQERSFEDGGNVRTQARLKLGYYPLAPAEARRIRRCLQFSSEQTSVLDPCAGTGAALSILTEAASATRHAVELDSYRAEDARKVLDLVIQGSAFDAHAPVESYSLLYLNPPYDFEIGEGKNRRMEALFLEHVGRWVRPGGVLVMVVPYDRVYECRSVLTLQFRDKAIFRLTEPEATAYKQVVVLGVRRSRQERERLNDQAVQQANWKLNDLTRRYEEIPPLGEMPDRLYPVPPSPPARLEYRGLPLDIVEDLLRTSPAWRQSQRVTHAPKNELAGRPLTPLHKGHVGLLCTAGLMNGIFGEGKDLHVAYWESVKVVDRAEEEGGDGEATVIREKERFSQRLTLLYADGGIGLLSEKPSEKVPPKRGEDAQRSPEDGNCDVCPANS